jgi:signal transduction histidine kinase
MRVVRVPAAQLERQASALLERDMVQYDMRALGAVGDPTSGHAEVPRALVMALRRGGELVGVHAARYSDRAEPCTRAQERIAHGIAQLASLALENARLVAELDRANRVKGDFVASMSHELRTPLNVIIGYSDLLVDQIFGELEPEQRETVRRIGEQGRELLELVNTTLDMSKLESGNLPIVLQEVDLVDLLAEIELEAQLSRRNAALSVSWDVEPQLPKAWSDPLKLKIVIKNLLLNALKFTDEGGVVVRAATSDGGVEVVVSDSGIGIAPDMIPCIFEAFRQGDHGEIRRGGVGLGLHIVRRLLDMLGGTIEVESELRRGSTFRVWLPARVLELTPRPSRSAPPQPAANS